MGSYNTYGEIQLKVSDDLSLKEFKDGDEVDIPDGAYLGYGGIVVVKNGKLVGTFDRLQTSWGGEVDIDALVKDNNPMQAVVDAVVEANRRARSEFQAALAKDEGYSYFKDTAKIGRKLLEQKAKVDPKERFQRLVDRGLIDENGQPKS